MGKLWFIFFLLKIVWKDLNIYKGPVKVFSRGTRAQHLTLSGVCVVCGIPWMDAML